MGGTGVLGALSPPPIKLEYITQYIRLSSTFLEEQRGIFGGCVVSVYIASTCGEKNFREIAKIFVEKCIFWDRGNGLFWTFPIFETN